MYGTVLGTANQRVCDCANEMHTGQNFKINNFEMKLYYPDFLYNDYNFMMETLLLWCFLCLILYLLGVNFFLVIIYFYSNNIQ